MRADKVRQHFPLFVLNYECVCQRTQIFHCSAHIHNDDESAVSIGFGVTSKFQQVGKFANIESTTATIY